MNHIAKEIVNKSPFDQQELQTFIHGNGKITK